MLSCFHLKPERHEQTDRRTDRIAISISRVSVLTRDKNQMRWTKKRWWTAIFMHVHLDMAQRFSKPPISQFNVDSKGDPYEFMHDLYNRWNPETARPMAIFCCRQYVFISIQFYTCSELQIKRYTVKLCVTVIQGHWCWYLSEARMRFLFVCHCNCVSIFYCFRVMTTYWLKIAHFCTPHVLNTSLRRTPSKFRHVCSTFVRTRTTGLIGGGNRMILSSLVLTQYQCVTEERTDGRIWYCKVALCTCCAMSASITFIGTRLIHSIIH